MIKLIALIAIIICWYKGGQKYGRLRDVACPLILGLTLILCLQGDLLHRIITGMLTIGLAQVIRLGYGVYDPQNDPHPSFLASIIKDRQGAQIRAIWGLLVGILTPLALLFMHFLIFPAYFAYIVCNVLVNYSVSKFRFPVLLADVCVASAFGSILFYI